MIETELDTRAAYYVLTLNLPPNAWGQHVHPIRGESGYQLLKMQQEFGETETRNAVDLLLLLYAETSSLVRDLMRNAHENGYPLDDMSPREVAEDMEGHIGAEDIGVTVGDDLPLALMTVIVEQQRAETAAAGDTK